MYIKVGNNEKELVQWNFSLTNTEMFIMVKCYYCFSGIRSIEMFAIVVGSAIQKYHCTAFMAYKILHSYGIIIAGVTFKTLTT